MPSTVKEPNALLYNTCLYDGDGNLHVVSHMYEMGISKRLDSIKEVLSYGTTYTPSPLLGVHFARKIKPVIILTDAGRKIYTTPGQQILTSEGFVGVDSLGMRMNLKVVDWALAVEKQYGFRKYSRGKYRVQSFLRQHQIPFEDPDPKDYDGPTITADFNEIYCMDYATEPSLRDGILTLGINNYREFLMNHYGVGEFSFDKIKKMYTLGTAKHCLTVEVDGLGNYITHTGAIFKSSPHTGQND